MDVGRRSHVEKFYKIINTDGHLNEVLGDAIRFSNRGFTLGKYF